MKRFLMVATILALSLLQAACSSDDSNSDQTPSAGSTPNPTSTVELSAEEIRLQQRIAGLEMKMEELAALESRIERLESGRGRRNPRTVIEKDIPLLSSGFFARSPGPALNYYESFQLSAGDRVEVEVIGESSLMFARIRDSYGGVILSNVLDESTRRIIAPWRTAFFATASGTYVLEVDTGPYALSGSAPGVHLVIRIY